MTIRVWALWGCGRKIGLFILVVGLISVGLAAAFLAVSGSPECEFD